MILVSENVCIDKSDDVVNKYNNSSYSTIKLKPIGVKSSSYIKFCKKINEQDSRLKISDTVRISKYIKTFLQKSYVPNWSEESFVIKNVKKTVLCTHVASDLKDEEVVRTLYVKELQKTKQKEFSFEKVIRRKGEKLYVEWKGYDSSFNSWVDKKYIV